MKNRVWGKKTPLKKLFCQKIKNFQIFFGHEKCGFGKKPFFYEVSQEESIDLDTEEDFKILNFYLKK